MPPVDRIHEQNEQDPGRVAHTRQEAGSTDFLAVSLALRILTSAFKPQHQEVAVSTEQCSSDRFRGSKMIPR